MKTIHRFINLSTIVSLIALILGIYLRITYAVRTDFPVNDGGLFYTMTQDLIQNKFQIPIYTNYNQSNIPYGYPPGGFYLLGLLNKYLNIKLLDLFRFLPLAFNTFSLLLIFPIARKLLNSERQASLATIVFAILPPSYLWYLMGGGVTRAPAFFFSLLAIYTSINYLHTHKSTWIIISVISSIITAYFHIEIAWLNGISILFLAIYHKQRKFSIITIISHAVGGVFLLSPYWLQILQIHGTSIFLRSFSAGYINPMASLVFLILPVYTGETIFPIMAVLGLLGGWVCLANRRFLLVLWLLILTAASPRSIQRSSALPESMLIAVCLDVLIISGFQAILEDEAYWRNSIKKIVPGLVTGVILLYGFILSALQIYSPNINALSSGEREAFNWVATHTDPDTDILILPSGPSWEVDWLAEWLPALSHRRSLITVQGSEWLDNYQEKIEIYESLSTCLKSDQACFQTWRNTNNIQYTHLIIPKRLNSYSTYQLQKQSIVNGCDLVFYNKDIDVYSCKPADSLSALP